MSEYSENAKQEDFDVTAYECAVLDCGVNISDPQLKNIAVMTDNEVSFLQMIGRKRTQDKEKINIWVTYLQSLKLCKRICDILSKTACVAFRIFRLCTHLYQVWLNLECNNHRILNK